MSSSKKMLGFGHCIECLIVKYEIDGTIELKSHRKVDVSVVATLTFWGNFHPE